MIVKMMKYQFVLRAAESAYFIEQLRALGMVDVTTTGYEPSEGDRELIMSIESHTKADKWLAAFAESEKYVASAAPYTSGEEAYESYLNTSRQLAEYKTQLEQLRKAYADALPWGDFSSSLMKKLNDEGVELHLFVTGSSAFEGIESANEYNICKISQVGETVYFVIVTDKAEPQMIDVNALAVKELAYSSKEAQSEIERVESATKSLDEEFSRLANSRSVIAANKAQFTQNLEFNMINATAESAAEGHLLVMEGWAEASLTKEVEALLESQSDILYFKSKPTPEDNTPVKLHNNWYVRLFEMIGNLYAQPKYGTVDLTPFFAPFYMLFFAICLCDAGYGAIIAGAGLLMLTKGGEKMRQPAYLSMVCGAAAIIFGVACNSFFGLEINGLKGISINFQQSFFNISMMLGIVHVLLGMIIKIYVTTRRFGFKYALSSFGWLLIIVSAIVTSIFSDFDSPIFKTSVGVGAVLLIFFNDPDKNPLVNIGGGVWGLYNRMTALLGDVLSYIRLFAIGLSGGILAVVFNSFATGITGLDGDLSGEGVVSIAMKVVGAALILLVGHGINLFMSTISSLVHPMRLTFVEFYGNAGFEIGMRKFKPLKSEEISE